MTRTESGPTTATPTVTTGTVRRSLRRWLFWIAAIVVAILVSLVSLAVVRAASDGAALSASSPTPSGAKALVEVLRQQGVTVVETDTIGATVKAARDDTTIFVFDPESYLKDAALGRLRAASSDLVLMAPDFTSLQQLAPDVAAAGDASGTRSASCSLPAAAKAGSITTDGVNFRAIGGASQTTTLTQGCFPGRGHTYSVIRVSDGARSTTVIGATSAFDNGHITTAGNAALALNLLGERSRLLWYLPSAADVPGGGAPTLAELTPPWLTGFLVLGILTAIAAAFWRGRRFGALVVENLPVTVRASETMEGRARLYAASNARLHALDALRIGTVGRLARVLGLPRLATVGEIVAAAASATGDDPAAVARVLIDADPATDSQLVLLSDELLRLEARVSESLRPATGSS